MGARLPVTHPSDRWTRVLWTFGRTDRPENLQLGLDRPETSSRVAAVGKDGALERARVVTDKPEV